ncbi:MFS-type transporter SLC18B1 [Nymphon striatum]|nr:MFS-type transporter SLC18B1 [Nymphon striatum]
MGLKKKRLSIGNNQLREEPSPYLTANKCTDFSSRSETLSFVITFEDHIMFYVGCMLCRIIQGVGYVGIQLSSMSIIMSEFHLCISTLIGVLAMAYGFGASIGPFIAGLLFDNLGVRAPFLVISMFVTILWGVAFFIVKPKPSRDYNEIDINTQHRYKDLICIPELSLPIWSSVVSITIVTFMDISFAPYLHRTFDASSTLSGAYLIISPFTFSISSPVIGHFVDRMGYQPLLIMLGSVLCTVSVMLIGPAPFLGIAPSLRLISFALVMFGFASTLLFVPVISFCFLILRRRGLEEDESSKSFINCLSAFAQNFGNFIGPFIGGFLVDLIDFQWTTVVYALITVPLIVFGVIYLISSRTASREELDD